MLVLTLSIDGKQQESIESGIARLAPAVARCLESAAKPIAMAVQDYMNGIASTMQAMHSQSYPPGTVGSDYPNLYVRSGSGLQSILESLRVVNPGSLEGITGTISGGTMGWHEEAQTMSPRHSQYMTIPLPAAMDSRGIPLKSSARDWANTFVRMTRNGNLIMFQKRGLSIIPLYLLKSRVSRPARLGMQAAFEQRIPWFESRVLGEIDAALDRFAV